MESTLLKPFIDNKGVVILDGALGTELEVRGVDLNHPLWSGTILSTNPGLLQSIHEDYLRAGADVICTAGYQASPRGLTDSGFTLNQAATLIERSVELACTARGRMIADGVCQHPFPLVCASIGPYGAYLANGAEYDGHYHLPEAELVYFHLQAIEILASTKADYLAFETVPSLAEAEAIATAMNQFPGLPYTLSFSCADGTHVSSGDLFVECIKRVSGAANCMATGINCTHPKWIAELLSTGHRVTDTLLLACPNGGQSYQAAGKTWTIDEKPFQWAEDAIGWVAAGAKLVGGCCGTGPKDIARLRSLFPSIRSKSTPPLP